jgi:ADP-ribose pyrophosphatase YjhB (NUDIX family)
LWRLCGGTPRSPGNRDRRRGPPGPHQADQARPGPGLDLPRRRGRGLDATVEDALRRELAEELGATADGYRQVFLSSDPADAGVAIQYFFVARLTSLNLTERYGPEFSKPERGGYDLDYVPLRDDSLDAIDLKPAVLKEFVLANRDALLAEAGFRA